MSIPAEFQPLIEELHGFDDPTTRPRTVVTPLAEVPTHLAERLRGIEDAIWRLTDESHNKEDLAAKNQRGKAAIRPFFEGLEADDVATLERYACLRALTIAADRMSELPPYEDDGSGGILPTTAEKYRQALARAGSFQEGLIAITNAVDQLPGGTKTTKRLVAEVMHDGRGLIQAPRNDFAHIAQPPLTVETIIENFTLDVVKKLQNPNLTEIERAELEAERIAEIQRAKEYSEARVPEEASMRAELAKKLPALYPHYLTMYESILRSHAERIGGCAHIGQHNLKDTLRSPLAVAANRFRNENGGHRFKVGTAEGRPEAGVILLDVDPDLPPCHFDPVLMRLIEFNVVKNALKVAEEMSRRSSDKEEGQIGVAVQARVGTHGCIEIFIYDTGPGISYDQIRAHQTQVALMKRERGEEISRLQELLLSQMWREHVTPRALNRTLLDRGESFAGGTGLGLAMVRQMMEMQNGDVDIFDHPEFGACMWLILPNSPNADDVVGDLRRVEAHKIQRMREQMPQSPLPQAE